MNAWNQRMMWYKVINQSKIVLNNKKKFRSCFDLQRNFKRIFTLYSNEEIKSNHSLPAILTGHCYLVFTQRI